MSNPAPKVRWKRRILLVLFLLVVGVGGLYAHALYQWRSAQIDVQEGRSAEAFRRLRVCLLVWPRSVPVHLLAARAARIIGEISTAEAHLNRCLKLQNGPSDAVRLEFLLMRIQLGEVDEVAPVLLKCVNEDHPESALILETLAGSYMNNLRYRPAIICLNRWIKLDPDAARPYHWRGWIHDRMNYAHEAMEDYKEALERDPDLVAPRLRLAELLIEKSNNPPMAREHLDILAEKHPERADVKARLGQCLVAEGRHDLARTLLEEAVESLPKDPLLLITLARLDLVQQRPERAEEWIRRVLKIDPADHEARYVLFTALQQQNRPRDAAMALADSEKYKALVQKVNDLLKLETDQPSSDPATAAEAGRILLQIEQERLGLYWLAQALKRDPNYQSAHKVLAEHYERKGDHENANLHRRKLRNEPRTK